MKRRALLSGLGGAAIIAPVAAHAQHKTMPVIGWLAAGSVVPGAGGLDAFRLGLAETGYVEGQNLAIEYRRAEGHYDRLPALAADLVSRKVDVIVSATGTQTAMAAKNATSTIPIIFVGVGDPVGMGLVASISRPGGNITGFSNLMGGMSSKVAELLSELVPRATTIAVLINPNNPAHRPPSEADSETARTKGVRLTVLKAGTESEIDAAFATLPELHADALFITSDFVFNSRLQQIVALTSRYAIPAIFPNRDFAVAGGPISYGPNYNADYRPAGVYVGRILKGEKPADLPVQQPSTFELVINLKTAKALGVTVPQSILAFADEMIE
jgi:putative tryptophan/tyrosine transport system substrate-binding protein